MKKKAALHNLGCKVNAYEVEAMQQLLEKNGWTFLRNGGNHDIYTDGKAIEPISRQKEIKEAVAKAIIRRRKLK